MQAEIINYYHDKGAACMIAQGLGTNSVGFITDEVDIFVYANGAQINIPQLFIKYVVSANIGKYIYLTRGNLMYFLTSRWNYEMCGVKLPSFAIRWGYFIYSARISTVDNVVVDGQVSGKMRLLFITGYRYKKF